MKIRLFHMTTATAAKLILSRGFRDRTGSYGFDAELTGVFVAAIPLSVNEGAKGDTALEITIDSAPEQMFYEWEIVEEGKPYREWCIPAAVLNQGSVRLVSDGEIDVLDPADLWDEFPLGEPDKTFAELLALEELDRLELERSRHDSTEAEEPDS